MADAAHIAADKQLEEMEKHIASIYKTSQKEVQAKAEAYLKRFAELDEKKKALVEKGKLSEKEYQAWRKSKIMSGKRYKAMQDQISTELARANETALAYINGETPKTYITNYTATGDGIADTVDGFSYELVDANTVKRLATSDKSLLPPPKRLDIPKDKLWNTRKINAEVLQGVLQGESMDKIAKRMQNVTDMNKVSAIRNARTMVTGAENAGRMDMLHQAQSKGIIVQKEWLSSDQFGRTRDWHMPESFENHSGLIVDIDEPFENDLGKIMFPGDPSADGANVYNCRCSLGYKVVGFRKRAVEQEQTAVEEVKETFRFYPAETQQQAAEYMSRITKGNNVVNIGKGVTLEQENAINMALTDIYNRYGVKLGLDEVKHTTERFQGAYSPKSKTFLVKGNKTSWTNNATKNYASNWNASGDPYQMFYHELGHAFWEELPTTAKQEIEQVYKKYTHEAYLEWMQLGGSSSRKKQAEVFGKYLSQYGHQDKYEFFSECFAQIMTEYDGDAAFEVGNILDELYVYKRR